MSLLCLPIARATDAAGMPLPGAKAFVFASGTTTPVTTYANAAFTVAHAHPVAADASGLFPAIYIQDGPLVRLVVTNSAGDIASPIFSADPINPGLSLSFPVDIVTGAAYTVTTADRNKIKRRSHSSGMTDTLPAAGTASNGFAVTIRNTTAAQSITVTAPGGGLIDGAASFTIGANQEATFRSDGTAWYSDPVPLARGLRSFSFDVAAVKPRVTNGCGSLTSAETANGLTYDYRTFSNSTEQGGQISFRPPRSWNGGTLAVYAMWTAAAGSAGQSLSWTARAGSWGDGTALNQVWGADVTVTDALLATDALHISPAMIVTPFFGSSGRDRKITIDLRRPVAGTLAQPARLVEIGVDLTLDLSTD